MKQKILFREALWVLLAICISFISIYLIFQLSDPDNLLFSADGFVIQNKNIFYYSIGWTLLAAVFIPVLFFLTILRQLFTKFRNKKQNIYFIVIAVFNLAHTIFFNCITNEIDGRQVIYPPLSALRDNDPQDVAVETSNPYTLIFIIYYLFQALVITIAFIKIFKDTSKNTAC